MSICSWSLLILINIYKHFKKIYFWKRKYIFENEKIFFIKKIYFWKRKYIFEKENISYSGILNPHCTDLSLAWFYFFIILFPLFPSFSLRLVLMIPPRPRPLHQLLRNISLLGRWSTSGSDRSIAHFFIATRNTIKGVGGKNKEQTNNMLGLTQSARRGVM